MQNVTLSRDLEVMKQRLEETLQENDYHSTLNRAGVLLGRSVGSNNRPTGVEAWGESMGRAGGRDDKDKMIDELRYEVRRVKDKYDSLKDRSSSPHHHHSRKSRRSSSNHYHQQHHHPAGSRPMVVTDPQGNVVMDPQVLERTVVELQDKVQRIKRYLPDYNM